MIAYTLQQALNALQVSAIYGLLAVSYVLIHSLTRRINFAFGTLAIWSSYTLLNAALWLMIAWPGQTLIPLLAAAAIALVQALATGVAIERMVVRPLLRHSSLAMLVATLGLALAMEEAMRLANDSRERWLAPLDTGVLRLAGDPSFPVQVSGLQIAVLAIALALAMLLILFIARHPFGRLWRACAQDLRMAELCGVDVGRTLAITFAIATTLAAAAGMLMSLNYGVASFHGGFVIGLKTLFVAVIGGLDSVDGAFAGALVLGAFETVWSAYVGADYRDAAAFVALSALMIAFPQGLTGGGRRSPQAV